MEPRRAFSWMGVDELVFDGVTLDEFVFDLGAGGTAGGIEVLALRMELRKVGGR